MNAMALTPIKSFEVLGEHITTIQIYDKRRRGTSDRASHLKVI